MRVVMVGPFGLRPKGTMSVRALPMAKALVDRGHGVTMLLPPWQNPEHAGLSWADEGVVIQNIPLPPQAPGLFQLVATLRLARRALVLRPDVIHLFKPKAYSGLVHWMLNLLPRLQRPHVVVDADDWEGAGGWNEIGGYTPAQRRFFAWQERWGLTHAFSVTVASRTLQSLVWAQGVEPERVYYVPNGIWNPPAPIEAPSGSEEPTILLYTRFFEFPAWRAISLLGKIREGVPEARLLVVGRGLYGEEETFLELARQEGLAEAIEYVGWVEPEELPSYFARALLAIYPYDDTLINRAKCAVKLLDLLAAGIPVVAEAVGQNRECICHGESGWLVEPGDLPAFADAVIGLLQNPELRQRLGQAASADVRSRLGWQRLVVTVEEAYAGNPPPPPSGAIS
jgi:glycosyltransferase involved in cell wall biosynthesis